tara:strand:- start:4779 stop:5270 length:492 start_codon:yes stop_codon:yes gene_type:complete
MSEIRVNNIKARTGLGTVSVSDNGLIVTGIVTSQTLDVTGNATITGNANIAGVLTYEDVTSVDSVGLVTARQGVRLGTDAAGVTVTGNATGIGIGNASPATNIDISTQTGAVALPQGTTAQRPAGNNPYIRFNTTNSALEFYNGTNWVEIITDYFPTGSTTLG